MGRFLLNSAIVAICFSTVWQNYAPLEAQQKMPEPVTEVMSSLNYGLTHSVEYLAEKIVPRLRQGQSPVRFALLKNDDGPLVIGEANDIITVYEDVTENDLATGNFAPTQFIGAQLKNANFSHADLRNALLDGVEAEQALFGEARMQGTSARVANFSGAVFHNTNLSGASLQGASFDKAIFTGSTMAKTEFSATKLEDALFRNGKAYEAKFNNARLDRSRFEGLDMRRSDFSGASLRDVQFKDVSLHSAIFTKADLSGAELKSARGLSQEQLELACGDENTKLPTGLRIRPCIDAGTSQLAANTLPSPEALIPGQ